eukprot:TRINITY_DN1942_c0_g2_i1.p1 TRINITY_DN1942_c0_g2~~TRINITY_DN1942_c0_g2_i1.p1  ORF type:complete len:485 (+),score=111.82 TRINITY_DN1942_c0_g2_i1:52-1506(+)
MDNDPTYEPIIGGHKSFSWEKELRERGMHASANEVGTMGDDFYEGPQGFPAPGSGSPRRDRVSASPARTGSYSPKNMPTSGSYAGSPVNQRHSPSYGQDYGHGRPSPSSGIPSHGGVSPPRTHTSPQQPAYQPTYSSQKAPGYTSPSTYKPQSAAPTYEQPTIYATQPHSSASRAGQPSYMTQTATPTYQEVNYAPPQQRTVSSAPGTDNDPTYEPIIGGHKSFSWEKELRERGMHASANDVGSKGDDFYEGPQGFPAPGSGSPRRDRVSASPARTGSYSPRNMPTSGSYAGSPQHSPTYGQGHRSPTSQPSYMNTERPAGPSPSYQQTTYQPTYTHVVPSGSPSYQKAAPAQPTYQTYSSPSYQAAPAPVAHQSYNSVSPPRAAPQQSAQYSQGRNPSPSPYTPTAAPTGFDNDPTYEPIIGGHKSFSWEKELRERGLHASANEVAARGDEYFEGPQGHPAPGSGSPRRDRVSPSPSRARSTY